MDKKFIGYRKKTNEEINELWNNSLFTFDTNSLLNLYRYSETSRNDIFDLLKKIEERVFITNHVAFEFNKNRFEAINEIIKSNKDFLKNFSKLNEDIISNSNTSYLSSRLSNKFTKLLNEIKLEIEKKIEFYESLFQDDTIYNEINNLFKNKFLDGFDDKTISEIEKEGEIRYSNKISPGYSDAKKEENKYGDLIIWKEIIKHSKDTNKSIIFISDDSKEDWIWKLKDGKTIGPKPELIQEFFKETSLNFHIYRSNRFIEIGSKHLQETIDSNTIEEVSKISEEIRLPEYLNILRNMSFEDIEERLRTLSPREADLLRLHLGVGNKQPFTLKEIASTFDLDLVRAIKIKISALKKLRSAENRRKL